MYSVYYFNQIAYVIADTLSDKMSTEAGQLGQILFSPCVRRCHRSRDDRSLRIDHSCYLR